MNEPIIDMCDRGHKYYKEGSARSRCPHCLADFRDAFNAATDNVDMLAATANAVIGEHYKSVARFHDTDVLSQPQVDAYIVSAVVAALKSLISRHE